MQLIILDIKHPKTLIPSLVYTLDLIMVTGEDHRFNIESWYILIA